ncbi:sialate O-acetylesterase [Paenibacillus sacheonensis]|uniref:Sialate O-acetylesterase domain-containing protein n=1 Tax=Paenibacillus sacheonensis TaxID=742054 RepID=A0A7X5C465_9BACL|nr:sialate O-acetylesterase [Paenibacillus sacheonensis]MBM7568364.1 sialate O-acetylesterase [Paenibacillus sacheonensis]NBC72064.1 hypothetical protein [Paenibacillus sacheonensis]
MLNIAPILGDGMVLQRGKTVPLWGKGNEGATVSIWCRRAEAPGARVTDAGITDTQALAHGAVSDALAEEAWADGAGMASAQAVGEDVAAAGTVVRGGRWSLALPAMEAGGPFELTVESEGERMTIRDIWFGEVWLAGGQSNMEMRLKDTLGGRAEAAQANEPMLRYYEVPPINYDDGREHRGEWRQAIPEHAGQFSAVAYYFALEILRTQGVPVGIIGCSKGATYANCWVSRETLSDDEDLCVYLDEFEEQTKDLDLEAYYEADRHFNAAAIEYYARLDEGVPAEQLVAPEWPPPIGPRYFLRPCGMYDVMLSHAAPYGLRGFLYYQGEADTARSDLYPRMMEALVDNWRADWGDRELPFLFVQLSNFGCMGNENGEDWALQREAQLIASRRIPGAGMAVSIDCGDFGDIHPPNKRPVGERLALIAREQVYREPVNSNGPVPLVCVASEDGAAELTFGYAEGRLASGGGGLRGFEIAGSDGLFVPATAEIADVATVVLRAAGVDAPAHVRYGWRNWTDANLFGGSGLPASPFRLNVEA